MFIDTQTKRRLRRKDEWKDEKYLARRQLTCPQSAVPDPNRRLRLGPARACLNRGTKIMFINASYDLPTNTTQGGLHSNASYHVSHIVRVGILRRASVLCRIGMSPEVKGDFGPSK